MYEKQILKPVATMLAKFLSKVDMASLMVYVNLHEHDADCTDAEWKISDDFYDALAAAAPDVVKGLEGDEYWHTAECPICGLFVIWNAEGSESHCGCCDFVHNPSVQS